VFDASVFHLEFDNQIGAIALPGGRSSVGNVGRAVHRGIEAGAQYDLFRLFAAPRASGNSALNFYANVLLLDAEFQQGSVAADAAIQPPDHVVRTGLLFTRGAG